MDMTWKILLIFGIYLAVSFPITVLIGKMMNYGLGRPSKLDNEDIDR